MSNKSLTEHLLANRRQFAALTVMIVALAACSPGDLDSGLKKEQTQVTAGGVGSDDAIEPGQAYLHINARKPGVQVMSSGLQFEMIENGDGATPMLDSLVVTHYEGRFVDGRVFDSSRGRGRPAEFPVNGVIPGWTEALLMMKEGDVWRLVIPPHLAYGDAGAGGGLIPPHSVLVFDIELLEVKPR